MKAMAEPRQGGAAETDGKCLNGTCGVIVVVLVPEWTAWVV